MNRIVVILVLEIVFVSLGYSDNKPSECVVLKAISKGFLPDQVNYTILNCDSTLFKRVYLDRVNNLHSYIDYYYGDSIIKKVVFMESTSDSNESYTSYRELVYFDKIYFGINYYDDTVINQFYIYKKDKGKYNCLANISSSFNTYNTKVIIEDSIYYFDAYDLKIILDRRNKIKEAIMGKKRYVELNKSELPPYIILDSNNRIVVKIENFKICDSLNLYNNPPIPTLIKGYKLENIEGIK